MVAAERDDRGATRREHARNAANGLECPVHECADLLIIRVPGPRQYQSCRHHALGLKPSINGQQMPETRKTKPRAGQEYERKADLSDHERTSKEARFQTG